MPARHGRTCGGLASTRSGTCRPRGSGMGAGPVCKWQKIRDENGHLVDSVYLPPVENWAALAWCRRCSSGCWSCERAAPRCTSERWSGARAPRSAETPSRRSYPGIRKSKHRNTWMDKQTKVKRKGRRCFSDILVVSWGRIDRSELSGNEILWTVRKG